MRKTIILLTRVLCVCLLYVLVIPKCMGEEEYIMDKYQQWQWHDAGAKTTYDTTSKEIIIEKSISTPAWGGAILELGKIDLNKDYYLKCNVVGLYGLYSIGIHYSGPTGYERNHIKIQDDTTIKGEQEYNVSEALRMEGLKDEQEIAMKIYVIDPPGEQQVAWLRLKDLSFTVR